MSKGAKIMLWIVLSLVVISILGAVYLKYVKPKMDEKKELKRLKEAALVVSASKRVNPNAGESLVEAILENNNPTIIGVGGLPIN